MRRGRSGDGGRRARDAGSSLAALAKRRRGSLPTAVQAEALRALERAEARHTAARARMPGGVHSPGRVASATSQGSARTWLRWQARVTRGAAAVATAWARRLAAHPRHCAGVSRRGDLRLVGASGVRLERPAARLKRDDADAILTGAARAGAELADLAGLAVEMYQRSRPDCPDEDGGFGDRAVWLGVTLGGAGRLDGDLTPGCAAALSAVLDSLGRRPGRRMAGSAVQRRHDALEEASYGG